MMFFICSSNFLDFLLTSMNISTSLSFVASLLATEPNKIIFFILSFSLSFKLLKRLAAKYIEYSFNILLFSLVLKTSLFFPVKFYRLQEPHRPGHLFSLQFLWLFQ